MGYTNPWSNNIVSNSTSADQIDDRINRALIDVEERMDDVLGDVNWSSGVDPVIGSLYSLATLKTKVDAAAIANPTSKFFPVRDASGFIDSHLKEDGGVVQGTVNITTDATHDISSGRDIIATRRLSQPAYETGFCTAASPGSVTSPNALTFASGSTGYFVGAHATRINCMVTGYHMLVGYLSSSGPQAFEQRFTLYRNGVNIFPTGAFLAAPNVGISIQFTLTFNYFIYLTAGDYMEWYCEAGSWSHLGGSLTLVRMF